MRKLSDYYTQKQKEYGSKFDPSLLEAVSPEIRRAYETGMRVKVKTYADEPATFGTIGITTGWKPCFLLMHNVRCIGSSYCIREKTKVLAVKVNGKYVPV